MTHHDPDPAEEAARLTDDPAADDPAEAAAEHAADEVVDGDEPVESPEEVAERAADELVDDEADADPVAAAHRERDEYLDALRRKQAEFENFRKRMMRDGAAQRISGHAEVAERMLDVLDDFDRTIAAAGEVDPGFLKGVQLVHDKLAGVLADFGLTRIDEAEVTFDPNRHEAVQQEAADEDLDEPVVTQVLRPGYELGGRTLRAAMVAVKQ